MLSGPPKEDGSPYPMLSIRTKTTLGAPLGAFTSKRSGAVALRASSSRDGFEPGFGDRQDCAIEVKDGFPAVNNLKRYAIGDRDALKFNADGSLDLYLSERVARCGQGIQLVAGTGWRLQSVDAPVWTQA